MIPLSDPLMRNYVFYATACISKVFAMAFYTAIMRGKTGVMASSEDYPKGKQTGKVSEEVERVRRNHLNDLENVIPFVILGFFYVLTNPDPTTALWHFRVFFFSRVVHTISYQMALQPFRGIGFMVGLATSLSVIFQIFKAVL